MDDLHGRVYCPWETSLFRSNIIVREHLFFFWSDSWSPLLYWLWTITLDELELGLIFHFPINNNDNNNKKNLVIFYWIIFGWFLNWITYDGFFCFVSFCFVFILFYFFKWYWNIYNNDIKSYIIVTSIYEIYFLCMLNNYTNSILDKFLFYIKL